MTHNHTTGSHMLCAVQADPNQSSPKGLHVKGSLHVGSVSWPGYFLDKATREPPRYPQHRHDCCDQLVYALTDGHTAAKPLIATPKLQPRGYQHNRLDYTRKLGTSIVNSTIRCLHTHTAQKLEGMCLKAGRALRLRVQLHNKSPMLQGLAPPHSLRKHHAELDSSCDVTQ